MKQSLKYHLPKLNEAISFTDFTQKNFDGSKYIAHCEESEKTELKENNTGRKTLILIGPEGDFSPNEIDKATNNNYQAISLGNNRLRTETAGVVSVTTINNNQ